MKRSELKRGKPLARKPMKRSQPKRTIRSCERCGERFECRKSGRQRFCSKTCANRTTAAARAEKLRQPRHRKPCAECEQEFEVVKLGQRWCSRTCCGKSNRRGRRVPKVKHLAGWGLKHKGEDACRNCGAPYDHLHHIVPRSKSLPGQTDLRNGMPLCFDCHRGWHDRRVTIPLWRLKPDELAYAVELTNPVWVERNYPPSSLPEEVEFTRGVGLEIAWQQMVCWLGPEYAEVSMERRPQGDTVLAYLEKAQAVLDADGLELARKRLNPSAYRNGVAA